ncbi:MAG TPA: hypothetical protein VE957_11205 [Terriglobales bacterium]|nr:hypothetical protein [Terriglobales bacterium]
MPVRLSGETENRFAQCINDIRPGSVLLIRSQNATVFRVSGDAYQEQRFGLAANGTTGFVSHLGIVTNTGLMFVPDHFCKYLLDFLCVSSLFYERSARFYGPLQLCGTMSGAYLFDGMPQGQHRLGGAYLFEPPLAHISQNSRSELEVSMHPTLANRLQEYLDTVLTDIARPHGSVLNAGFRESIKETVDDAVKRLISARNR